MNTMVPDSLRLNCQWNSERGELEVSRIEGADRAEYFIRAKQYMINGKAKYHAEHWIGPQVVLPKSCTPNSWADLGYFATLEQIHSYLKQLEPDAVIEGLPIN